MQDTFGSPDPTGTITPYACSPSLARCSGPDHAHPLRRQYLSHDLLGAGDGLMVVLDLELSHVDDGFEKAGAFRRDPGGDYEDAAPYSTAEEVFEVGHRRREAIFVE